MLKRKIVSEILSFIACQNCFSLVSGYLFTGYSINRNTLFLFFFRWLAHAALISCFTLHISQIKKGCSVEHPLCIWFLRRKLTFQAD